MFHLRFYSTACLLLFFGVAATAQTDVDSAPSTPPPTSDTDVIRADKKQSLNFEDELIEGSSQKPDLFYIFQKNNFKFKKLIKLRENFLPEMNRNAEDIQRLRGGR